MARFIVGHAAHPRWEQALARAAAQIDAQAAQQAHATLAGEPTLGFVYFSDHYAAEAEGLYAALHARWPAVAWTGCAGVGVAATGAEHFDEPALVLMLADLPRGRFALFSGAKPMAGLDAATALVHADGQAPELPELIDDLAERMDSGCVFGGIVASRTRRVQIADGVFEGGLSGVAFSSDVALVSRVTQGCQPVGATRRITRCDRNVVLELDGRPALDCLLGDLAITLDDPRHAAAVLRATLAGLAAPGEALPWHPTRSDAKRHRAFGTDVLVRHLIGIDPTRRGVAVAEALEPGMTLAFCQRDRAAARRDLVRICAEIRDSLVPETVGDDAGAADAPDPTERMAGAIYVSCAGRGGPHFGAPSAELQIVRHALGDVPLAGFFAAGEIGAHHLYGYTGVLTVFTRSGSPLQ
ncbi:MAG TPA: FIST N-terminal domain-containing protein [Burkholderiaceae bacterium]|nr:FIST N-terminal domain-containing protein [Burkholderiaceae bacterium]